jgi:pimeloyl-ACP methyl ester carboxylesterase
MAAGEFDLTHQVFESGAHRVRCSRFPGGLIDRTRCVIAVPGYLETAEAFARLRPLAARFDLRLMTFSAQDRDPGFDLIGCYARRVVEFANRLESPVLLGTSFGGLVALRAAGSLHHALRGLILISSFARLAYNRPVNLARRLHLVAPLELGARLIEPLAVRFVSGRIDEAARHELHRQASTISFAEKHARLMATLGADMRSAAAAVRAPVLVVHGTHDRVVPIRLARDLASLFINARFVDIEGAAHVPYLTHPGAVIGAVEPFLSEVFANAPATAA